MSKILIANAITVIASMLMIYSGYIKNKKSILYVQTIQFCLQGIGNLILGGITGAITCVISCVRNILCYKDKLNIYSKIIIITLSVILTVAFNNLSIIGFIPLVSTIIYVLLMDIKDIIKFKYLMIFTMVIWLIYYMYIKLYSSAIFDLITIITTFISIFQLKHKKNNDLKNN